MIYKVVFSNNFKKQYKKLSKINKRIRVDLNRVIDILRKDLVLPKKYKNHRLHGSLNNFYECHVKSDWLLIYEKDKDLLVLTLVETGTHSTLFE
jgi:mRNA interferase YafQ